MATKKKASATKAAPKKAATAAPKKTAPAKKPLKADEQEANKDLPQTTSGLPLDGQPGTNQPPATNEGEPATAGSKKGASKTLASKDAFDKLNSGKSIRRAGWPEGQSLQVKDGNVYQTIDENRTDLYSSTQEDAAATDWELA